jgi:hypothetical protein
MTPVSRPHNAVLDQHGVVFQLLVSLGAAQASSRTHITVSFRRTRTNQMTVPLKNQGQHKHMFEIEKSVKQAKKGGQYEQSGRSTKGNTRYSY